MFTFLNYSLGRLEAVELSAAEAAIRDHVTKRDKLKKASFTKSNASPIFRFQIPPCTPVWPDVWKCEKGMMIDRILHIPFALKDFVSLLPLVRSHPGKLEVSVSIVWPRHGVFLIQLPLNSIHERVYRGFSLRLNPHPRQRHSELFEMLKCMFGKVSTLWSVEDDFIVTPTNCKFSNDFTDTPSGRIRCTNDMQTPDWAATMSYANIEDFQFASQLAEKTAKVLVECMGRPKCIEVKVASFVEEATIAAEYCQSLAPKWYTDFYPSPNKKFNPFKHPGHSEGTRVYPVAWNANRANEIDMEDFMDIYTAVEHHPDGSRLLLATNHDDAWLKKTVAEVGYGDQFELLGDEAKYADIKPLVKNVKRFQSTPKDELVNYPTVKLSENASLDVAYEQAVAAFESADLYVHRHDAFSSLGGVGKIFSCHEDERNDTFIVHAGPWTEDAIDSIKREAESLLEMQGFMGCTGVQIIATHPLPAQLSQFANIESP